MANRYFNKQVANSRAPAKTGGRMMKRGGGMSTARKDMRSGYYTPDMGMEGGAMYKKGGRVKKKSKFPDHSGDGKITKKDILMAKGVIPKKKKNA